MPPRPQQKQHHVEGSVSSGFHTLLNAAPISCLDCLSHFIGPFDYGTLPHHGKLWSGPINAVGSRATVGPLTFPIPCWFSIRVYQRETEAPLKSLFPSITFTADHTVKDGVNAGAGFLPLLPG